MLFPGRVDRLGAGQLPALAAEVLTGREAAAFVVARGGGGEAQLAILLPVPVGRQAGQVAEPFLVLDGCELGLAPRRDLRAQFVVDRLRVLHRALDVRAAGEQAHGEQQGGARDHRDQRRLDLEFRPQLVVGLRRRALQREHAVGNAADVDAPRVGPEWQPRVAHQPARCGRHLGRVVAGADLRVVARGECHVADRAVACRRAQQLLHGGEVADHQRIADRLLDELQVGVLAVGEVAAQPIGVAHQLGQEQREGQHEHRQRHRHDGAPRQLGALRRRRRGRAQRDHGASGRSGVVR